MSQSTVRRSYAFFCVFALLTIAANASAAPVAPVGAVSRKTHGSAGTFDIPLPLTGPAGIECRSEGGVHHMVVTFAAPVTLAGASVAVGQGSVSNSSTSGNQVTVDLSGVTNAQRIVIKLSSVSDGVSTNDVEIPMSVLLGDVNGDGYVLSGDYTAVRQHSAAAADGNTLKLDINADGVILSGDYTTVRGQSGMSLSWSAPSLDRLATGNDSVSLVLKPDTSLWSWGTHPGDGSTQPRSYPLALTAVPNPVSLSAGSAHAAVLASDGVVWSWGANQQGQIGDGTIGDSNSPVAMLSNVIAVKAGSFHTLALLQDGTVASWGKNNYGQLGKGDTTSSVVPVAVSNLTCVKQVAAGYERSLALKTDGTLWRWGLEKNDPTVPETIFNATPSQVTGLTNVTAIAAGLAHAVAVKSDGTIWAWGSNQNGELGNSSVTGYSATPVQVSNVANAIAVSSSFDHTLALCSDGTVWAWGANNSGQLGNGNRNFTSVPVQVSGLTDVVAIAAARSYSMALKSDGTVVAWGENTLLLGIAPGSNNLVPQQAVLQLLDLNANGIDDRWEMQYFGNLNQTASGDFDGDGISNLQEFQNGTIPNDWYNGATPYPVFRAHNRAAAKTKQGFPTFIVVNPIRFFLKQVNTTSIEGGNPESPVGGVITTTVDDLDTGHTTEERSGNPIDFTYAPWGVSESYANNYATRIRIQHTHDD